MYSAPYGYGNAAAGQPFNGAPPGQNPQMQPGPGPSPNQHQQQMMYNQQYPMGPGGTFSGAPNPSAMMSGAAAGRPGMMQNPAMPQMPNGQMGFQAPFTSSPYGPNVPSTAAPPGQFNSNYMMANSMSGYSMNPSGMNPQQQQQQQIMMQRMHQAQQNQAAMGTPNHQRQFSASQGTPNPGHPGPFGTPQNPQGTPQPQPPSHNQTPTPAPPSANSVTTPQTPTFPPLGQSGAVNGNSTPVSPGTQARDQERMGLLLEINTELLYEVVHLKHSLEELRKENANAGNGMAPEQHMEKKEEEEAFEHDYSQVFRRLQANLQYLANLTTNKPGIPRQPAPMVISAPPLNMGLKLRPMASSPDAEKVDGGADREERDAYIKDLYKKLHGLFPGMDPTKEPVYRPQQKPSGPNPAMAAQNAQRMASMSAAQGQMQMSAAPSPASSAHQTTPQMAPMAGLPSAQVPQPQ